MSVQKDKVVLFDLGRVLIDVDFEGAARNVSQLTGRDPAELYQWFENAPELQQLERGQIGPVEYYMVCKKELNLDLTYDQFAECWNNIFTVKWEMVEYFRSLHGRVRLGILSNTNELHFQFIRERYPFLQSADYWILSYRVGMVKPERAIYQKALDVVGLSPEDVFFTDDRSENVLAAEEVGMKGIQFQEAKTLRAVCDAFLAG